jgi:hypothetical protein
VLALALALAGCGAERLASVAGAVPDDIHIPPFARWPYQPFSREAAVQIALREWRAFGQQVVYPNTKLPFDGERAEGLWQRVGEYWWLGLPMSAGEQGYTGRHDRHGMVFPDERDGIFAWSAAFVSYVMRTAGAGKRFPYSGTHSDYINAARLSPGQLVVAAERPELYVPRRGDLICMWRGTRVIQYDQLPAGRFASHCDIVVEVRPGALDVVGGNLDNSVAMRRIPTTPDGRLVGLDGRVADPDHPWFVVIRVDYDTG